MSEIIADFGSFETDEEKEHFLEELLNKQITLSVQLCFQNPNKRTLLNHLKLMLLLRDSNFNKKLAKRLNSQTIIDQFSQIFANVVTEMMDSVLLE